LKNTRFDLSLSPNAGVFNFAPKLRHFCATVVIVLDCWFAIIKAVLLYILLLAQEAVSSSAVHTAQMPNNQRSFTLTAINLANAMGTLFLIKM
jgi:hypothetical protein